RMTGFVYQKQTWNNCGPSNITMALSYYGWRQDQAFAAQFLKPGGREDKNVSPSEMVAFVNEQSAVRALYRIGGTVELIKTRSSSRPASCPRATTGLGITARCRAMTKTKACFTFTTAFWGRSTATLSPTASP
ncbi:MAG: C39 family peptidase, partial [Anaerolineae bacterium]|nr:C39 family peptidase [Anaerolineae bacterium]